MMMIQSRCARSKSLRTVLATLPQYSAKIEREGIEFRAVRPDPRDLGPEEEWIAEAGFVREVTSRSNQFKTVILRVLR